MSANNHWMPLYIGDYLADTMHLGAREHGAYLLLIMHYWRTGPLPNDDAQLAAIARVDLRTWRASVGPKVLPFFRVSDTILQHTRIETELRRVANLSDVRREAAMSKYRKQKEKSNGGGGGGRANAQQTHSKSSANDVQKVCEPQPQPQSQEERDSLKRAPDSVIRASGGGAAGVDRVVHSWNEMAERTGLTPIIAMPPQRRAAVLARVAEHGVAGVMRAIAAVEGSEFCMGGGGRGWKADFDWLMGELNICKVIEGKYAEVSGRTSAMDRFRRDLQAGLSGNVAVFPAGRRIAP